MTRLINQLCTNGGLRRPQTPSERLFLQAVIQTSSWVELWDLMERIPPRRDEYEKPTFFQQVKEIFVANEYTLHGHPKEDNMWRYDNPDFDQNWEVAIKNANDMYRICIYSGIFIHYPRDHFL